MRDDSGVYEGYEVPIHYDPLLSKLAVWAARREEALSRMRRALAEYKILGIRTTLPFLRRVLQDPDFVAGEFDTSFVEKLLARPRPAGLLSRQVPVAAAAIRTYQDRQEAPPTAEENGARSWWRSSVWRDWTGDRL